MIYYKCLSYVGSANACISKELFVLYHYLIEQNNHHICVWVFQVLLINNALTLTLLQDQSECENLALGLT